MSYYRRKKYYSKKRYYKKKNSSQEIFEILFFLFSLPFKAVNAIIRLITTIIEKQSSNSNNTTFNSSHETSNRKNREVVRNYETLSVQHEAEKRYEAKDAFITECEKKFFEAIRSVVGENYIVQPQINLASIVNKTTADKYRNELFRNIDFGVFDKDYKLLVLIEINDPSHDREDRRNRDDKVKKICNEANIPLVTFWTKYGINDEYIKNRLSPYLSI